MEKDLIKELIKTIFENDNVSDEDFASIVDDHIIPILKILGYDLEKDNNTSYENVIQENY